MAKMQSLSFRPFQICVLLWLGAKGFGNIRPLGRHHQKGRRSRGGADFLAKVPGSNVGVAIQIRHWKTPVQRRAVDELWGFMLRNGVPSGLIVTNSSFMKSAPKAVPEFAGRPIQLVSCRDLCSSMASLELGLRKQGQQWILDESFFRSVDQLCFASTLGSGSACARSARILAAKCHLPDLGGEAGCPDNRPSSLTAWMVLAAAILVVGLVFWLKLGVRP
ncbi:MAG: restriction endonuclease [Armatimonadetes bacterium]|nr:restriction endonuclease [Armatimonadota bacterium]